MANSGHMSKKTMSPMLRHKNPLMYPTNTITGATKITNQTEGTPSKKQVVPKVSTKC